jgi:tRNA pseudouridine55 synthase
VTADFEAGVFLIDKPVGPTSFAVVRQVRRVLGIKKVGHAGTLDPFASGLLIVCAGRPATKLISSFMDGEKEYLATICLGRQTTTLDPEGQIVAESRVDFRASSDIERCLEQFRGEQQQKPPAYSALKHKGKPLYYYARQGIEIEKEPRTIQIHELERIDGGGDIHGDFPELKLRVVCSKGTYIRTLAADIGDALGCGAYLRELRRTRTGPFTLEKSFDGKLLSQPEERDLLLQHMLCIEDVGKLLQ